ncbi:hypothetical protein BOTBODRAFT_188079 [Botryobasidium botryosum FD-172 SS1]|uniref:Uncharacterized protein n=1 Tax=Botryobasidium botryosum (strain FD-172 SS1) TaxID=930990 RepID=A0A067MF57_BOTB1|nr:hypothetical protein BOTBODRAFT_188079 [Botryobasidium botryosum FD-172 SS1]
MRFAAIFASVLSLGFLAAAAPTPNVVALAVRDTDLAVRSNGALVAKDIIARCDTCNEAGSALLNAVANIHVDISASIQAITTACHQPGVTVDILAPLIVELQAHISAFVDAVVKANVSLLGLVHISIDLGIWVQLCVSIFLEIIVCLQLVLSVCADARVQVASCVQIIIQLIVKANACVPGCGQAIIAGLQAQIQACIAVGLNLSAIIL